MFRRSGSPPASHPEAEKRIAKALLERSRELDLSGLALTDIPGNLSQLSFLEVLDLGSNKLHTFPSDVLSLSNLRELFLNDNPIQNVPDNVYLLSKLEILDLSTADLRVVCAQLGALANLKRLDLDNNKLTAVPSSLGRLEQLEVIWLDHNNLKSIPSEFGRLRHLRILGLNGNPLQRNLASAYSLGLNALIAHLNSQRSSTVNDTTPGRGNRLAKVRIQQAMESGSNSLDLSGLRIRKLPREISQLRRLRTLHASGNRLTDFIEVCDLPLLETLDLSFNNLTSLPPEIGRLRNLKHLWLNNNNILQIPPEVGSLVHLRTLWLSSNGLTQVPTQIGNLADLESLDLSKMSISYLPSEIGDLKRLQRLDLDGNSLTSIPREISKLTNLRILFLDYNSLSSIPVELSSIPTLRTLSINGNPLPVALRAAYSQGYDVMLTYMRSLVAESTDEVYETKVVLLGEGRAGKTCLVDSLIGRPFVRQPATHGASRSTLEMAHPLISQKRIALHFWDFGGQEAYQAAHSLFFSPRAIYLIVWDVRVGAEQGQVILWLDRVRGRIGGQAAVILVGTCSRDFSGPVLDLDGLRQAYGADFIREFYIIDNYTDDEVEREGIQQLQAGIVDTAVDITGTGDQMNVHWAAVRQRLAESPELQLPYSGYELLCQDEGVPLSESVGLARLLHALGDLLYFADDPSLQNILILKPDWAVTAIDYVLSERTLELTAGVLPLAKLSDIWEMTPLRKEELSFPRWTHAYLIRLMELLDICYRVTPEDGDLSRASEMVVTLRLPDKRPRSIPWHYGPEGGVSRIWRTNTRLPQVLMAKVIARTHTLAAAQWKTGIFLSHTRRAAEALIEQHDPFTIRLMIRGSDQEWLYSLADCIESVFLSWPDMYPRRLISCPRCLEAGRSLTGEFRLDLVAQHHDMLLSKRRIGRQILNIDERMQCGGDHGCGAQVPVAELITGVPYRLSSAFSYTDTREGRSKGITAQDAVDELRQASNRVEDAVSLLEGHGRQIAFVVRQASERLDQLSNEQDLLLSANHSIADNARIAARLASEATDQLRPGLAELSDEGRDGPRLFTIVPAVRAAWRKIPNPTADSYQLTLWCEYPGGFHPIPEAMFVLSIPSAWWLQTAPYLRLVARSLRVAVPILGTLPELIFGEAALANLQTDLKLAELVTQELSEPVPDPLRSAESSALSRGSATGIPSQAERGAIAALHALLRIEDPEGLRWRRALRKTYIPSQGSISWLCMQHWGEFARPLPRLYRETGGGFK